VATTKRWGQRNFRACREAGARTPCVVPIMRHVNDDTVISAEPRWGAAKLGYLFQPREIRSMPIQR